MASCTKVTETRRRLKQHNMGRARKNKLARVGSTPTKAQFFGDAPAKSSASK